MESFWPAFPDSDGDPGKDENDASEIMLNIKISERIWKR